MRWQFLKLLFFKLNNKNRNFCNMRRAKSNDYLLYAQYSYRIKYTSTTLFFKNNNKIYEINSILFFMFR